MLLRYVTVQYNGSSYLRFLSYIGPPNAGTLAELLRIALPGGMVYNAFKNQHLGNPSPAGIGQCFVRWLLNGCGPRMSGG